ncbi:Glycerol-3-phosphate dehydrogenase [NAD(P)+] [hydrothermal vent metagenome]|uniref:Glycerol-3-phosphate dehydrogenase [NAD(P)+] n=1 Tax=hydrothermal vent metagenome TaxID=652676 RepID=A0A3B0SH64_9ZZZZ
MSEFASIGILGGGAWGTALAQTCARAGRDVQMWVLEPEVQDSINTAHENKIYLPGFALNPAIRASNDIAGAIACDAVLSVIPAQHTRSVFAGLATKLAKDKPVLLCSKGIEQNTGKLMTQVLAETLPQAIPAVLSGPSFAVDVAAGLPAAVTLACKDVALGQKLMLAIGTPAFRPYLANDLIGAEIGGAVKNVLAIACGIVLGKELGQSAHAALITRGFAEMTRLGLVLGASAETLRGLCGLGDLVLTCSSPTSRNMSCGLALGQGTPLQEILSGRLAVTEGVASAPAMVQLAHTHNVEMPITEAVAAIIAGKLDVDTAITALLSRPLRAEQ